MQNDDPTIGVFTLKKVKIDSVHYAEIRSNGTVSIIRHMSPETGVCDFHCVNLPISAIQIIIAATQHSAQRIGFPHAYKNDICVFCGAGLDVVDEPCANRSRKPLGSR